MDVRQILCVVPCPRSLTGDCSGAQPRPGGLGQARMGFCGLLGRLAALRLA
jgi:hypothetical protein